MDSFFSATYSDARANFLEACLSAGVPVQTCRHPLKGPQGEVLATDVAWIGPRDAAEVVVVVSGTHGAEGYCGSGLQVGFLRAPDSSGRGDDQALMLVHAINPFGFAWMRRVNEDNIDLNRNFVDHQGGNYPENDLFEVLEPHIIPESWDEESIAACAAAQAHLAAEHGEVAVRKAIAKGQYRHPDNVHYGGTAPAWSNRTLHAICAEWLGMAREAVMVDVHTGLGPYGYGELMTPRQPGSHGYDRPHALWGDEVHCTTIGATAYAGSPGSILNGFQPKLADLQFAAVGLEYGTRERAKVRRAVAADTWLHRYGDLDTPLGRQIKADLRDAFYPEESAWKAKIWERGQDVVQRAFVGLSTAR